MEQRFVIEGKEYLMTEGMIEEKKMKKPKEKELRTKTRKCKSCYHKEELLDGDYQQKNCPKCERGLLQVEYDKATRR